MQVPARAALHNTDLLADCDRPAPAFSGAGSKVHYTICGRYCTASNAQVRDGLPSEAGVLISYKPSPVVRYCTFCSYQQQASNISLVRYCTFCLYQQEAPNISLVRYCTFCLYQQQASNISLVCYCTFCLYQQQAPNISLVRYCIFVCTNSKPLTSHWCVTAFLFVPTASL